MAEEKPNKTSLSYEDLNFRNTVIDRMRSSSKKPSKQVADSRRRVDPFKRRVISAASSIAGLKGLGSSSAPNLK